MLAAFHRRILARSALAGPALLIATTTAMLLYHVHWAHARQAFLAREQAAWEAKGAARRYIVSEEECRPSLFFRLVGERGYNSVFFAVEADAMAALTEFERDKIEETRRLFPEARVCTVFIDNSLPDGLRTVSIDKSLDETSEFVAIMNDFRNGNWW